MALSEIEVVSSESKPETAPAEVAVFDVFSASAYGDFQKLRSFVEQDGASLSTPDANGYYALQWAALNNFPDIAHYIIQVFLVFSANDFVACCPSIYLFLGGNFELGIKRKMEM